jgi:hypothetical protein
MNQFLKEKILNCWLSSKIFEKYIFFPNGPGYDRRFEPQSPVPIPQTARGKIEGRGRRRSGQAIRQGGCDHQLLSRFDHKVGFSLNFF